MLTQRQSDVLTYMVECTQLGWMPTVRELQEMFCIRSPNGIHCHIKALERKGMLSREHAGCRPYVTQQGFEAVEKDHRLVQACFVPDDSGGYLLFAGKTWRPEE